MKNEIQKLIAEQHRVILSDDDPIMMLHTMNEFLLQKNTEAIKDEHDRFLSELEALFHRLQEESKVTAEQAISATLTAHKQALNGLLSTIRTSALDSAKNMADVITTSLTRQLDKAMTVAVCNMVASGCLCVAVVATMFLFR